MADQNSYVSPDREVDTREANVPQHGNRGSRDKRPQLASDTDQRMDNSLPTDGITGYLDLYIDHDEALHAAPTSSVEYPGYDCHGQYENSRGRNELSPDMFDGPGNQFSSLPDTNGKTRPQHGQCHGPDNKWEGMRPPQFDGPHNARGVVGQVHGRFKVPNSNRGGNRPRDGRFDGPNTNRDGMRPHCERFERPNTNRGGRFDGPNTNRGGMGPQCGRFDGPHPNGDGMRPHSERFERPNNNRGGRFDGPNTNRGGRFNGPNINRGGMMPQRGRFDGPKHNRGGRFEGPNNNRGGRFDGPNTNRGGRFDGPNNNRSGMRPQGGRFVAPNNTGGLMPRGGRFKGPNSYRGCMRSQGGRPDGQTHHTEDITRLDGSSTLVPSSRPSERPNDTSTGAGKSTSPAIDSELSLSNPMACSKDHSDEQDCANSFGNSLEHKSNEVINRSTDEDQVDIRPIEQVWMKKQSEVLKTHDAKILSIETALKEQMQTDQSSPDLENIEAVQSKLAELQQQKDEFSIVIARLIHRLKSTVEVEESKTKRYVSILDLRKSFARECHRLSIALPMYAERNMITQTVRDNKVIVVMAETGSGKSTQMAQYLYEDGLAEKGMVVCTQPRKVAAVSLAEHVSTEMGSMVGDLVGYKAGMKSKRSKNTKIIYMTDHALLNECIKDRLLSAYSCIIVDEAHERSIFTDLLLGMVKKCLDSRDDLRVVITSATINPDVFVNYFPGGCPIVRVAGRTFPVEIIWRDENEEPVGDYVSEAVHKAKRVIRDYEAGDILVFLSTPPETEKACERLQKIIPNASDKLVCLPLHGKLQPDDQKKVFDQAPPEMRKVIFATNSAETSITIPGIKYVIDSGYVKEKTFDAKRNMSSLEVVLINRSSAEQRKGRAGRTQAGKCFRLYTETTFLDMRPSSAPEILRVHLGQALLMLYELGIEDPLSFQFVESPSPDSLKEARKNLEELGAVNNGKISRLGRKMIKLPLEPRLGKLVFEGIEHNVGFESLILASFATVTGSVFFRVGSDEEKNRADQLKAQFGHSNGDLLSLLNVYREWYEIEDTGKNRWCFRKSINAKAMRIAAETIKEMCETLRRDVGFQMDRSFCGLPDVNDVLAKLIFRCFASNLCMFSGHDRIGYNVARLHQLVHIHPSSCLNTEGMKPEWIVYDQLLKTSRDFALNITTVKEEWVEEYAKEHGIHFDIDEMKARKITPVVITDVGPHLMRTLKGPMCQTLKGFEKRLKETTNSSIVVIETDSPDVGSNVNIYIADDHHDEAKTVIGTFLEDEKIKLAEETIEEPLDDRVVQTRAVIGRGGSCTFILSPGEHKTVFVEATPNYTREEIKSQFSKFGIVEGVFKLPLRRGSSIWGKVVFSDPEAAESAVCSTEKGLFKALKPGTSTRFVKPPDTQHNFEAMVEWCRRAKTGSGCVIFENVEARVTGSMHLKVLQLSTGEAKFYPSKEKEDQMFVRLHPSTTEVELLRFIKERVNGVTEVRLFRAKPFPTTTEQFIQQKSSLHDLLSHLAPSGFQIRGSLPKPTSYDYRLTVGFSSATERSAAINNLNGRLLDGQPLKIKMSTRASISISSRVFDILKVDIEGILKDSHLSYWESTQNGRVRVNMEGEDADNLERTKLMMQSLVGGEVFKCSDDVSKQLFTKTAREFLKKTMHDRQVYVVNDVREMNVVVYGSTKSKAEVKLDIQAFLDSYDSHNFKDIPLCSSDMPRGLIKALIKQCGVDFEQLKLQSGARQVELLMKARALRVHGSDDAQEKVMASVRQIADGIPRLAASDEVVNDCVVCFCPIEDGDMIRLEYCGHAYCKECAIGLVDHAMQSKEFPITCPQEGCSSCLVRRDFINFQKMRSTLLQDLKTAAVSAFVQRQRDKYRYCPTADCPNVYKVSSNSVKFTCEACQSVTCPSCHKEFHPNVTCAQLESNRDGDELLKRWMESHSSYVKACPKCKVIIEKNDGCSHMTCTNCYIHICWNCGALFDTGDACYNHQPSCSRVWRVA